MEKDEGGGRIVPSRMEGGCTDNSQYLSYGTGAFMSDLLRAPEEEGDALRFMYEMEGG